MPARETPLPALTKLLNEQPGDLRSILESQRPSLLRQIEEDAATPGLFAAWARSSNIDAGAKRAVVLPELLVALNELAGQPFDPKSNVANAGLLHTYGYLLSNLKTPFGVKRARWTNGNLERGLGLPRAFLSPKPRTGTLLSNLNGLFGRVFSKKQVPGFTLTETMPEPNVTLITKLIEFPDAADEGDCAALFYACKVEDEPRFVTAFPVGSWMIGKLWKSGQKTEGSIQSRYNAVIPELQGRAWPGTIQFQPHE